MNTELQKIESKEIQIPTIDQAKMLIESGMLPPHIKTPQQLITIAQMGKEQGLTPLESVRRVFTVNNKPDVEVAVRWGKVQKAKLCNGKKMLAMFTCKTTAGQSCTVVLVRQDEEGNKSQIEVTYTMDQATKAGLTAKDIWKKYPDKMLFWRAIGNAIDMLFPDVRVGLHEAYEAHLPEELVNSAVLGANKEQIKDPWEEPLIQEPGLLPQKASLISAAQRTRLFTIAKSTTDSDGFALPLPRWTDSQIKSYLLYLGYKSSKDILVDEYDSLCEYFANHAGHEIDTNEQVDLGVLEGAI